jgi:hypothetical protein
MQSMASGHRESGQASSAEKSKLNRGGKYDLGMIKRPVVHRAFHACCGPGYSSMSWLREEQWICTQPIRGRNYSIFARLVMKKTVEPQMNAEERRNPRSSAFVRSQHVFRIIAQTFPLPPFKRNREKNGEMPGLARHLPREFTAARSPWGSGDSQPCPAPAAAVPWSASIRHT